MVIPKSQGKVPYRDARKSAWGDAFPHDSKNKVVTRMNEGVVNPDQK
jgi:ribosomal protein RSM22 (predicted rRNA methylase)